jgi:hypothetical protein
MARRLTLLAVLTALIAAALVAPQDPAGAPAGASRTLTLDIGDRIHVDGAGIGCRVTRLKDFGGQVFLDCRRAGRLAGTYATFLGKRQVHVVRFGEAQTGRIVFSARHKGSPLECR